MINAAHLPAVRARADGAPPGSDAARSTTDGVSQQPADGPAPGYPSKRLVLVGGRYVVAEPTK